MKIAIHKSNGSFSGDWATYCNKHEIDWIPVNCYDSNIMQQLATCDILMWHFHHANPKDTLFAKQLLYSADMAGLKVHPNFQTCWHFDDKIGQKYLLEGIGAPLVPTYVFYSKQEALNWVAETTFPKVFKLRGGAGSSHVKLARTQSDAEKLISIAFGKGFRQYSPVSNLKERVRLYANGKTDLMNVLKGLARLIYTTEFDRVAGREKGYAYFQDFIPDNDSDIRVIVVDGKAFAIKRYTRENDFRASGSGSIGYKKELFPEETVKLTLDLAETLKMQVLAADFVFDKGTPKIVEISSGYTKKVYEPCEGYWDREMNWHAGPFNPQHWMVESIIQQIQDGKPQ